MSPQAAGYLVKYMVDSIGTDLATSSGPHGISLSVTIDDDVFMDETLREAGEKTPDSQDNVSERSVLKVSPGAVRQEVSQAISDKKGMLIILKEAEDKEGDKESCAVGVKGEPVVPRETEGEEMEMITSKEKETLKEDSTAVLASIPTEVKKQSPKMDKKNEDMTQIKDTDSPKKAMASWISAEVKTEASEVITMMTKEVKEIKTCGAVQQTTEIFAFEEENSKSSLTQITASESSATIAVVLYK